MQKFGETVVNRITPEMDRGYVAERKKAGVANKTVNLELSTHLQEQSLSLESEIANSLIPGGMLLVSQSRRIRATIDFKRVESNLYACQPLLDQLFVESNGL